MTGWIRLHRSIWEHPAFPGGEFSQREAFLWLVSQAAWKPASVRAGRHMVDLERGQCAYSVRFLAERWGWSKSRVGRFLKGLKERDTIGTQTGTPAGTGSGTALTVITICNYDAYQSEAEGDGTLFGTDAGTGPDEKRDKEEESKNQEKKESVASDDLVGQLWSIWPATGRRRSGGKRKIAQALARALKRAEFSEILTGARAYVASDDCGLSGGQGLPAWLNQEKWAGYAEAARPRLVAGGSGSASLRALGVAT